MLASFHTAWVVHTRCPGWETDAPKCSIPLPHQSPLGIYEDQKYRPTGTWPATFLCLRHGISGLHSAQDIRLDTLLSPPGEGLPTSWEIEVSCAHENCGKVHTIYTARMPSFPELADRLMRITPAIHCDGHDLIWRRDLIQADPY